MATALPAAVTAAPRPVARFVLPAAVGAAALAVLVHRAGGRAAVGAALLHADREWLLLAAACAATSYLAAALAQRGAAPDGPRTPGLGRLTVVQLACAFTNRLLPAGAGAMATNARALRRAGLTAEQVRGAVSTNALAGVVMHVVALLAVAPALLAVASLRSALALHPGALVATPLVLAAAGALLLRPPALVAPALQWLGLDRARLRALATSPRRSALLLGGSLGITAAHAGAFVAALHAVGLPLPLRLAVPLYVVAVAAAGVLPTPGGVGGVEAALVLALLAVGAGSAPAAAAVLVFRLVSFWLPVVPGALALVWLLRRRWV